MGGFRCVEWGFDGVYHVENYYQEDDRGFFRKIYNAGQLQKEGIAFEIKDSFVSSSSTNVIRGLHFQTNKPQGKIVSVLQGGVWDVIVDLRKDSRTFGEWKSIEINAELHNALIIPRGFAHGFLARDNNTLMLYQCDELYDKESDSGIKAEDAQIGIVWPISIDDSIRSERDKELMTFEDFCAGTIII